jgi:uncharacterized protein (DUF433 family)
MKRVLDAHIAITPGVCGGKPRVAGRRITVADIAVMNMKMGMSVEEIAGTYDLTPADVHAALAYYYDHRAEIDKRLEKDAAFVEALRKNNPSRLQAKLQALRHA